MQGCLSYKRILIIVLLISFTLSSLISITAIEGDPSNSGKNVMYADNLSDNSTYSLNPAIVKVLIYDGDGVIPGSVDGVEDCLNYANNENLDPNVHFNYSTTKAINSETLAGYDVLIMPGGLASTYLENPEINSEDIKDFVKNGKGYVGICAGSYAASSHVDGYYDGWGIAPHINSKSVDYMGNLQISMTQNGENILSTSDTETLYHWNGPAMYETYGSNVTLAEYKDNETDYQDYAAIVNDTYGSGRVILSGPHPELNLQKSKIFVGGKIKDFPQPQNPEMLVRMILWAAKEI